MGAMTIRLGNLSDRTATSSNSEALRAGFADALAVIANAERALARDCVNVRRESIGETHA